ncbi:MAG: DUF3795 domain-containing protein [Smithellaceae bacterium]|nr:DUF3795 domain-containing protein [Syntrophaceae bacterium]MDX9815668.1 DUF3795 domain-containing protein [Smithellaceae bacterium]NMD04520.1 DUF3795 domain-containing protein [Deltaproteobacteria bacterium]HNQ19406.1 DUF3795 domain-containing protein [Smithellaceae bacterium]HOD31590.1 DUF3795 domain-containing protein [Smithellaceae bacterium]
MKDLKVSTAVCGIDCFNCELYFKNIDSFFEKMSKERKAGFTSRGMTKEKLLCKGCRISGCTMIAGKCETLECAKLRKLDFCFECSDFPCSKLQPLAEGADRYPHNLKIYNLTTIKNKGLEKWASEVTEIRERYFKGKFKIGAGPQK